MAWSDVWPIITAAVLSATTAVWLSGCVALPPVVSAAGGWYTHDRIDKLEVGRIEALEKRVGGLEEKD